MTGGALSWKFKGNYLLMVVFVHFCSNFNIDFISLAMYSSLDSYINGSKMNEL